jgi:membrane protease YdiL (CAAX protease family)
MTGAAALPEIQERGSPAQVGAWSGRAIVLFVVLAFAWSWGIGFAAVQAKASSPALNVALMISAGFGPSLAGLVVVAIFGHPVGLLGWARRCLNWRVGWRWFLLAFLAPPAVMVCALALHIALGAAFPELHATTQIPFVIANFGLVLLIGGPLGEEFGWRGYLMSALTVRTNWRIASLVVGIVWGFWHLPLFFITGTAQAHMPIAVFLLNILGGSVLFGWLFQRTQQSVLPALVLHTSLNASAGILAIVPTAATAQPYMLVTALLILIAGVLLILPDRTQPPC